MPPSYDAPYSVVVQAWPALTRLPADEVGLRLLSLAGLLAATSPMVVEYSGRRRAAERPARRAGRRVAAAAGGGRGRAALDDDVVLRQQGLRLQDSWTCDGTSSDLVLQRWSR